MRLVNRIVVVVDVRTVRIGTEEQPRVRVVPPAVHIVQVQRVQAQIPPRAIPAVIIPRRERGWGPRGGIAPRVIRAPTPTTTPIQRDVCYRIPMPVVLDVVRVVAINVLQIAARACHLHAAGAPVRIPVAHEVKRVGAGDGVPGLALKQYCLPSSKSWKILLRGLRYSSGFGEPSEDVRIFR